MAISTYAELQTAVGNWLTRAELTERIPEFIAQGEAHLFTDLRVREMEASSSETATAATRTTALPTRFVQARSLYVNTSPIQRLEFRDPVSYWSIYADQTTGVPRVYTVEGENLVWGPVPDANYAVVVAHYARPAALSSPTDTNSILTRWPQMYLMASLIYAAPFLGNDPRVVTWTQLYENIIAQAHAADLRDRASGDAMTAERRAQVT